MTDKRKPDWQTEDGSVQLYCADCLEILPTLEGIDTVIADPPYGIGLDTDYAKFSGGKTYRPLHGDSRPFDFSPWQQFQAKEQFWFGAENYLPRTPQGNWLCWDKYPTDKSDGRVSGQFELIWSRVRHKRVILRVKAINTSWATVRERVGHPTQKPIELIRLLLEKFTKPTHTILDPFMGSGTTGVACIKTGRKFIGVEIDRSYFDTAVKRIKRALAEQKEMLPMEVA